MASEDAVDALRRLVDGGMIDGPELDALLREGLITVQGEPRHYVVTDKGNEALGRSS